MLSWSDRLYTYGFLLTDDEKTDLACIGLNKDLWNFRKIGELCLYTHPTAAVFVYDGKNRTFLLIGHAYNPFTMEQREEDLLAQLDKLYGTPAYLDYFDQLTGMFFYAVIENGKFTALSDCAGEYGAYYTKYNNSIFYSSYSQLIADLCGLKEDPYVTKLKKGRFFHMYGRYLPGDLSPYAEVKRILPNTQVIYKDGSFAIERIYPRTPYEEVIGEKYDEQVKKIGQILYNTLSLITKKWKKPAISLTGGTDSQTTLACTGDLQNAFRYFSYISLPREETDANAAATICKALGLQHETFRIDVDPANYPEFNAVDHMIERHGSYIGKGNQNDVCKRLGLNDQVNFDVEVKSWVSEVARASRNKMYSKKQMPKKMTPRRLTTMYKIFMLNRGDAIRTDKRFKQYMEESGLKKAIDETGYSWSEFFVWEIVFGGWGSIALTGEHRLTNDITIPYNNRALLDMMLRTPLEKRRTDTLHWDVVRTMKPELAKLNVHVLNGNETKLREIFERVYFDVHSHLPL